MHNPKPGERQLRLILHDIRSTYNVGSMLRSADGFGVENVYLTGITPYPEESPDARLPHIRQKLDRQIHKSALGAEKSVNWNHRQDIYGLLGELRSDGFSVLALEQAPGSAKLHMYRPDKKSVLIAGSEVDGLPRPILDYADEIIEIPMSGSKESFNVASAAAVALYHLRYAA